MLSQLVNKQVGSACRKGLTTSASTVRCMAVAKDYLTPNKNFFSSAAQVEQPLDHHPCIRKEKFKKLLEQEREHALMGGGAKRIARQHEKGSLTARERIELLFDKGTNFMMPILKDIE
jgi:hypothetical protein